MGPPGVSFGVFVVVERIREQFFRGRVSWWEADRNSKIDNNLLEEAEGVAVVFRVRVEVVTVIEDRGKRYIFIRRMINHFGAT